MPESKKSGKSKTEKVFRTSVSIQFTKSDIALRQVGSYGSVMIKGGVSLWDPGHPALPSKKFYISVPWGCTFKGLTVRTSKFISLSKQIVLEPSQPDEPTILGNSVEWVGPDTRLYASDRILPSTVAAMTAMRLKNGFSLAEVTVCPFRYKPKSKQLDLIGRVNLTLEYTLSGKSRPVPSSLTAARYERKYKKIVEKIVLNPNDVHKHLHFDDMEIPLDLTTYPEVDYVIVTSDALAEKFQRLARWRTLFGIRARVVTTEDILAGSVPDTGGSVFLQNSGYSDGGTRDEAEAIRNFLKWAHANWLTDYVLLGGDTEIIPQRQALHTATGAISYSDINTPLVHKDFELGYNAAASSSKAGHDPANVQDDDETSTWECTDDDTERWIRLQAGSHKPVNRVNLVWGAGYPSSYVVEVSPDAVTWTQVHAEGACTGGTDEIGFSCVSTGYVRVRITSNDGFSLATFKVYGPARGKYNSGYAYAFSQTKTRIYLSSQYLSPNPGPDENLLLIKDGPHAGHIVPYDSTCSASTLGWRFVEDLPDDPGTVSTIKTQFVEVRGPAAYHGNAFAARTDTNYIPADLYYADILVSEYPVSPTHDWDADDNGIYGERFGGEIDGVNGIADVQIGRAPVQTTEEVDTFIDKILRYERYVDKDEFGIEFVLPLDFATSVLLGSQNWGHTDVPGSLDGSAKGKEDIRHSFISFDPNRWTFTRRYQDYADVPAADTTADLTAASKAEIIQGIQAGNNVVSLSSHGSSNYLCYLVGNDIDDLHSHPAIFYGNACSTNKFDVPGGEALSEKTITNPYGSAVAYAGNSRFGWMSDNPMELAFWEAMLDADRLGDMFEAAKLVKLGWQAYSMNLLGDPAMRVWSDAPCSIDVGHPDDVCSGAQTITVVVTSAGNPVQDATVCLTQEGSLCTTETTDASGVATFASVTLTPGNLRVGVSAKNLIPYLGTITVESCPNTCPTIINCGKALTCKQAILCTRAISCGPAVSCKKVIACRTAISCLKAINCVEQISCGMLINCGKSISCKGLIACGQKIICAASIACPKAVVCKREIIDPCKAAIGCGMSIDMCPTIRPGEFDLLDHIRDLWGGEDLKSIAARREMPEIKETIERLPDEIRKPMLKMLERIDGLKES